MIQRIQTVYLLLVAVLTGLMLLLPLATFTCDTSMVTLTALAIEAADGTTIVPTTYMGVLILISTLLPLVTIFLFKHRWVQIRLCIVEIVLQAGIIVYLVYYITKINGSAEALSLALPDVFPIVSIILSLLAYRGVVKDETLIKSLNRIR